MQIFGKLLTLATCAELVRQANALEISPMYAIGKGLKEMEKALKDDENKLSGK